MTYSGATTFDNPNGRYGRASSSAFANRNTTYSATGVIPLNTILATYDCNTVRSVSIQCVSMGTAGVVTPEWSNDGTTWVTATLVTPAGATAATINSAGLFNTNVVARYLRLRMSTATTAGTTTLAVSQIEDAQQMWQATQPVSGTVTVGSGSSLIGDIGVQYRANVTGAASFVSIQSGSTTTSSSIKASAGRLLGFYLQNSAASLRSVKIFNATTVTMGTTTAAFEIDLAPNQSVSFSIEGGMAFSTAIRYAVTSAKGLTDNTGGIVANDVSGYFTFI